MQHHDPQHRRGTEMVTALGHAATTAHDRCARSNIRNTSSPHRRMWLKPGSRCLVPANSFAEYAPEPNPETKKEWFGSRSMRIDRCLHSPASGRRSTVIMAESRSRSLGRIRSIAS